MNSPEKPALKTAATALQAKDPVAETSAPVAMIRPHTAVPAAPAVPVQTPAPAASPAAAPANAVRPYGPPAAPSKMRRRHWTLVFSFFLVVITPLIIAGSYLYTLAADRFDSTLGFSVRREDLDSAFSLISGLASVSGSSSADTDIIYRYIYSQQLVTEIDAGLDLRAIWSKPDQDFIFALPANGSVEDLVDYWERMVNVYYDSSTRIIEVRVQAFDPEDAQNITQMIYEKSTEMINRLNDIAVQDGVRHSERELEKTRDNLVLARQAITAFRNTHQIVDPAADVAAQMEIVGSLEQMLAETFIELDILKESSSSDDPRRTQMERRIRVIEFRITAERKKLGVGANETADTGIADLVVEYERLAVDQQYAENAYQSARAAHEVALSEAQRQTRYLAAHILPTRAETSRYPDREITLAVVGVFLFMLWAIGSLVFYSVRDRR